MHRSQATTAQIALNHQPISTKYSARISSGPSLR
jgi:hypothetical protein